MQNNHVETITTELNLKNSQIQAVANLLSEGGTVPFIARYRKEATGSLDETQITAIRDRLNQLAELDSRRDTILNSLEKHGHLTDELKEKVLTADNMSELEDIYLPYKPKRRTKGTVAREKGLEPLALLILGQQMDDPEKVAQEFIDEEKGVTTTEQALEGARHIIAEIVNEDEAVRSSLRDLFRKKAVIISKVIEGKEVQGAKYKDYFDWQEPVSNVPSHRLLAMRRGEKEDILNLSILPDEQEAVNIIENLFLKNSGAATGQVKMAVQDSYKRLLSRSMETELRINTKEQADQEAITVFAENLRELLLASPLGAKRVLGIDPGFRTGCKVVCLDRQGKLLHNTTIYPHSSDAQSQKAVQSVQELSQKHAIEAIAIGNGTAGRETETFIRNIGLDSKIHILLVNESGASIYSASEAAREEFPDHDLTVRGAVSIGRRLMDPLAELVKIDPKSIGVGQYQHDVDQAALKNSLDDVVVSCVNAVGVDVNRASAQLLTYVSGLGPQLARNIVTYRDENGPFENREKLKKIPRLGPKAFEQAAGFLRIPNGGNLLDASAVHPESYRVVYKMAEDKNSTIADLIGNADLRKQIEIKNYVTDTIGLPTLMDIMDELTKPGRDPRKSFEAFAFAGHVSDIKDLEPGMQLPAIVTNVTRFGAFVDVGVHQDGLVHISELADHYVTDPSKVIKVNQKVNVTVLEVDLSRKRISLSMRTGQKPAKTGKTDKNRQQQSQQQSQRPQAPKKSQPKHKGKVKEPFHNPLAEALKKLRNLG
ncbi:MAG: RNA-binding transcriptional accessory protein [Desulfobacteraceae bacterium]|nr:RNA-binding transcriptional accessory protein [Desulfobacteraceae bacterium]